MEGDEHAVRGEVSVGLEEAVAEGDRGLEGAHGVLGRVLGAAPVGDRQGSRLIEVRPA